MNSIIGKAARLMNPSLRLITQAARNRLALIRDPVHSDERRMAAEVFESFDDRNAWQTWVQTNAHEAKAMQSLALRTARRDGIFEPLTARRFRPSQIGISTSNLRESLIAGGLNARMRALLLGLESQGLSERADAKILAPESVTPLANLLRRRFPQFLGTEYLPEKKDRQAMPAVRHLDIQAMDIDSDSFDVFISGDVIEHVPDLQKATREIYRTLKPGGFALSTFPFLHDREASLVKASLDDTGALIHHEEPEYHGNPVDPKGGSLVFTIPAWDILDLYRKAGFNQVEMLAVFSAKHGIVAHDLPVVHMLYARK